jgi:hypothetical protein
VQVYGTSEFEKSSNADSFVARMKLFECHYIDLLCFIFAMVGAGDIASLISNPDLVPLSTL